MGSPEHVADEENVEGGAGHGNKNAPLRVWGTLNGAKLLYMVFYFSQ